MSTVSKPVKDALLVFFRSLVGVFVLDHCSLTLNKVFFFCDAWPWFWLIPILGVRIQSFFRLLLYRAQPPPPQGLFIPRGFFFSQFRLFFCCQTCARFFSSIISTAHVHIHPFFHPLMLVFHGVTQCRTKSRAQSFLLICHLFNPSSKNPTWCLFSHRDPSFSLYRPITQWGAALK